MKINKLLNKINPDTFLEDYFHKLGIKDVQEYIKPSQNHYDDPSTYANMDNVVSRIRTAVLEKEKVGIVCDPDVDGFCAATIAYDFLKKEDIQPVMFFHSGKQHGITYKKEDNILQQVKDSDITLLWVPDAGSNDVKQIDELYQLGIDTVVTDHHEIKDMCLDTVVNCNNRVSANIVDLNFSLTGAGVTEKVVFDYNVRYERPHNDYNDLVAMSLISDIADMTNIENRTFFYLAQNHLSNKFLKFLVDKLCGKDYLTIRDIGWKIAPKINAVCRSGDQEAKQSLFYSFVGEGNFDQALQSAKALHAKQSSQTSAIYKELDAHCIKKDNVIVGFDEKEEDRNFLGLVANRFSSKYNSICLALRSMNPTMFSGSLRSPFPVAQEINATNLAVCMGHNAACGITLKKSDLKKLINWIDNNFTATYDVAGEIRPEDITLSLCEKIDSCKEIWGNSVNHGIYTPKFYTRFLLNPDNILICGKNENSIRIQVGDVFFWKFSLSEKELADFKIDTPTPIKVICTLEVNEWNDEVFPKAMIEKYEIIKIEKGDLLF